MSNTINDYEYSKYNRDYSSLFSSVPTSSNNSSGNGLVGLATEFSSIRSGSYKKLLSAYYKKMGEEDTKQAEKKENLNRQLVSNNASSLKSSAEKLKKMDFHEASEEDALKAVKEFVSSYNSVIDTADDVDSKGVLRNAVWMTNIMKKNAGLLSDVGITIGSDNKISLDEAKWKEASATTKNSLLTGNNSLADKMLYKASQMTNAASEKASYKASAYKPNGDYEKVTTESMYNTLT